MPWFHHSPQVSRGPGFPRALATLVLVVVAGVASAGADETTTDPDPPTTLNLPALDFPEWQETSSSGLSRQPEPLLRRLLSRRSAAILVVGGLLAAATTPYEGAASAEATARSLERGSLDFISSPGDVFGSSATAALMVAACQSIAGAGGGTRFEQASDDLLQGLAVTAATVGTLKLLSGRTRPNGAPHSFPSGHTATAFTVATVLDSHLGPRIGIPAHILAAATAIARVEHRKHYISDVIFGASVGIAVGLAVSDQDSPLFRPEIDVRADRAAFTLRF